MKETLLAIVKEVLSVADSEDVNTLSDTEEAMQAAGIVKEVWREIIVDGVPEHKSLLKLTALADTNYPTHFSLDDDVKDIECIWYDVSSDGTFEYREIKWRSPEEFLRIIDKRSENYDSVSDKTAGTNLRIFNNTYPTYYTTFDDEYIVMDAYKSTVDTTLQESKVRAIGTTYPTWTTSDTYVPDLDADHFPRLIQESKSRFFSVYKGQPDFKLEQSARRTKVRSQNDRHRAGTHTRMNNFGRTIKK